MSPDPENRRFLERPRVDQLLARALQSQLVTVVAGEGSGKTYAVNSFLQKEARKAIWVQFSMQDNLGWRSWENYIREVGRLNPKAAKIFADMGFPESERQFVRFQDLIKNEVISHEPYALVVDDFHLLTNPRILTRIEEALSIPISKNPVVFISRTEPAMNIVNFLEKGFLSQITAEDLLFTKKETDDYFRLHNVPLTEAELTQIFRKTEGLPLALDLVLQGIKTKEACGREWDRMIQPVKKMEEILFFSMKEELQKFLVKLSLIEHWPRDLLERLDPEGKNIAAMERFSTVIHFNPYSHSFRIHRLFLDFLQEKKDLLTREEIRELYREDARWCIENNLTGAAAVAYQRAGDCGGFIRLAESLPRLLPRVTASSLLKTAEQLIADTEDPLSRYYQEYYSTGQVVGENWDFLFLRFLVRARFLVFLDRFEEAEKEYRAGIACVEAMPPGPRRSSFLAAAYTRLGTLHLYTLRFTKDYDIVRYFERGYRYYLENPEPVQGLVCQTNINHYVIQVGFPAAPGEIDTYLAVCSAITPYSSAAQGGYLFGGDTLARAELAYFQGDFNRAEQFAREAVYQGREKNQYEIENGALFYLMRICVHRGDAEGFRELERQIKIMLEKEKYLSRYTIHEIVMGRFYIRLGLTEKITPWLRKEHEEGEVNFLIGSLTGLIKPRILFVEKDYPAALKALKREQARGELKSFLLGFLEMSCLEAAIRHRLDDREGACAALKKAYDAARPYGLNTPFIELGETMHSLTGAILRAQPADPYSAESAGIPREWLQMIRRSASANAKKSSFVAAQYAGWKTLTLMDFSRHELTVLDSLSQGHTKREIAGTMKIPVKMVKSVLRSLYVKLGAANRADAIRIATEKGFLQGS
jgi:LuxR family maltose regulon positive regulatory protein